MTPLETCIAALRSGPTDALFTAIDKAAADTAGMYSTKKRADSSSAISR